MTPGHTSLQEKHSERRFPLRTQAGPECIFLLCIGSTSSVLSISSDGAVTREKGPTGGNGWKKWRWHVASRLHHGWRHRPRGREGPPASFYRDYSREAMKSCCLPLPASSYTAVKIRKERKTCSRSGKSTFFPWNLSKQCKHLWTARVWINEYFQTR